MSKLSGKRTILTGASQGIGREIALQLAQSGARVALAARSEDKLNSLAAECNALGGETLVMVTDVAERKEVESLVDQTVDAWGGVDVLMLNAGISMFARFDDLDNPHFFERLLAVNYMSCVYAVHRALPHLKASRGQIVAVSSLAGKSPSPYHSGYAASKHALHGFLNSLRAELLGTGVDVTLVCPGFVATDIRVHGFAANGESPKHDPFAPREMSAEKCAQLVLKATMRRQREMIMTLSGTLGAMLQPFFPRLIDRVALKMCNPG